MRSKRLLVALAMAVAGCFGISASLPPATAAVTINLPTKTCQTVDLYTVYTAGGGNMTEVWQLTLRQHVTGCWTYATGQSTYTTAQDVYQSNFTSARSLMTALR